MTGGGEGGRLKGRDMTVLGAGIAGLAVALALVQRGARVSVIEQAPAFAEIGAGIQISPNATRVLERLGLGTALADAGLCAQAVELRDGETGQPVMRLDLTKGGPATGWYFLHRADLVALLWRAAEAAGVRLRRGLRVSAVDLAGPQPQLRFGDGAAENASLLIGADGLHSVVRATLNGAARPAFTGQVAWRALIPGTDDASPVAEVHLGRGRHLVSYPLRGGRLRNLVAVEERRTWVEEGWAIRDDSLDMRLAFADFAPRVRAWLDQTDDIWLWGLFRHPVAESWFRALPQGAVAILGDAAHPTLPFLAQGAAMGIEDAWVLADQLDRQPTPQALAAYQTLRAPRTARIVAAANGNARAYHLRGPWRGLAHAGLRVTGRLAPMAPLNRLAWLYDHDVTKA